MRRVSPTAATDGAWSRLARRVMRHPVAVLVPTLLFLLLLGSPFLHVRFNAPDATILPPEVPSRAAFDRLQAEFGEGEFAPIVLAIRTDGAATSPANLAAPVRLFAAPRRGSAHRPHRQPGRRRSAADAQPVHAPVRRSERAARPLHPDEPGSDDQGRPDGVHAVHAVRAEPRRGPGAGRGPPAGRQRPRPAGRDDRPGRWRRRRRDGCRRPGPGRLPAHAAVHRRHDLPRPVRPAAFGRPAGQGAGHEHAVDRGQLRGAGLDLPGRQPVGAARLPAARASSRRPSR